MSPGVVMADPIRVLALDGGGIKGYVAARLLTELDLARFNLIVGTSTGGILALALAAGIRPRQIAELYRDRGSEIFAGGRWASFRQLWRPKYAPDGLRRALVDVLGADRLMRHAARRLPVMVTTYDLVRAQSFLIKSWKSDRAEIPMVDAALATSAAPTYFPPHPLGGLELVDGGVYANSPGWLALTEARKLWPGHPVQVLSIGFGGRPPRSSPGASASWGSLQWVRRIAPVFMDSAGDTVDYALGQELGASYVRVAPEALEVAMDDVSGQAFKRMDAVVEELGPRLLAARRRLDDHSGYFEG